ncbi:hypothetical protein ACFL3G_12930 [Planctomycetota bacterium]
MIVLVQANVLTIGLNGRNKVLKELPIRLISMESGMEAARSLKNEKIDSVISNWDLVDMVHGRFLKRLKRVKPNMPTIAFVDHNHPQQEIQARSLGVSAVLNDNASDDYFKRTLSNVLGLAGTDSIKAISATKARIHSETAGG